MNYEKIIIDLLFAAGEDGLAVKDISRYVFNANNSFFEPLDYNLVHKQVSSYLIRNSKRPILSSEKVRIEARIV